MRVRAAAAAIVALAVAGLGPAGQAAGALTQRVDGSIARAMAHPYYDDGCLMGVQYQFAWLEQPEPNGVVGYQFEIDESTWGKPYRLRPVGAAGEVDLDIGFFPRFRPLFVYNEDYHPHATRRQGGESGIVPRGMTRAIVCLHTGSNVSFRYTARS